MRGKLILLLFLSRAFAPAQGIITTVAGTDPVFPLTSLPALKTPLGSVTRVASDAKGNVYFSLFNLNVVVRRGPDGMLNAIAGYGKPSYSGDGGPGTSAAVFRPRGLEVDLEGNVFVADQWNGRIRKIAPDGTITTVAGGGRGGDGGRATEAGLAYPADVALDGSGNLYIAESMAHRVRKVSPAGVISTIAGNGERGFSGDGMLATKASLYAPEGVAVDSLGNVFIADTANQRVRKVSVGGVISTVAGNGNKGYGGDGAAAIHADLNEPSDISLDADGNLFIADSYNYRIRRVDSRGTITTIAGNGNPSFNGDGAAAMSTAFNIPTGIAFDAEGRLIVADNSNHRVRRVTRNGAVETLAGNGGLYLFAGDGGAAGSALLSDPLGMVLDRDGNVLIADSVNYKVRKVSPAGIITSVAGDGRKGYSGDGGAATSASLTRTHGLAVSPTGDLFIADWENSRVRRVSPRGIIDTVAGTGGFGYSGDGGPATAAKLAGPEGLGMDAAGNLYIADTGNNRIRRVTPVGIITTVAGNGTLGFSGEGLAVSASLNAPRGVAVDTSGNIYIADTGNHRIRKVTAEGRIYTIAGDGQPRFSGDGGPASEASLYNPVSVVLDVQETLFVVDRYNQRIRKFRENGVISTVAGNGWGGYSGDGGPGPKAALWYPWGVALDRAGNVFIADTANNRIRVVSAAPVSLQVTPAQLSVSASEGRPAPLEYSVDVRSSVPGIVFRVSVPGDAAQWLDVSPKEGVTPGVLRVRLDPGRLVPGSYQGALVIVAPDATPSTQTVTVRLAVSPARVPLLGLETSSLAFSFTRGAGSSSAELRVTNDGSGALDFTVAIASSGGQNWLKVSPTSGSVTPVAPVTLTVAVDPAGLDPGTYSATIHIRCASTNQAIDLPVTVTVSDSARRILLSQSGLTYTAVAQGGAPLPQNFGVLNLGQGAMAWSVKVATLSGGSDWLAVTPASGKSTVDSLDVPMVDVAVNPSGLAPGEYYGRIDISAPGAENSPQTVSVALNVLPSGSSPGPDVRPTGLILIGREGSSPGSQNVFVSNPKSTPATYASGRLTFDGQPWFEHLPTNATVRPDEPARIVVQPNFAGLTTGVRRGALTLQFDDGTLRTVSLLTVVVPSAGAGSNGKGGAREASGCRGQTLRVEVTSLQPQFAARIGQPVPIEARVVDECGNLHVPESGRATAQVFARFSNGDRQLEMNHVGNGVWRNSWAPVNASAGPVSLLVTALYVSGNTRQIGQSSSYTCTLDTVSRTPQVAPGAVFNAASGGSQAVVSPGNLVSIYGRQLADGASGSVVAPLARELAGTEVVLGGRVLPLLYAAEGQVNAQIPYDLTVNTQHQLLVRRKTALSVPEAITVAAAQPAVFTKDMTGKGQGAIMGPSGALAETGTPVTANDPVVMYCTGLGGISPAVEAGLPAPSAPLSRTTNPVTVTIGGRPAQVIYAGLTPGFAGLYQVNAVVPQGVTPGNEVPVVLTVAGQNSPAVTMAVE